MATLIVFYSHSGCYDTLIRQIREEIHDDLVCLADLRKDPKPDISIFRRIVIGIPVSRDKIPYRILKFCSGYQDILCLKRLSLFICSSFDQDKSMDIVHSFIPVKVQQHASFTQFFPVEEMTHPRWPDTYLGRRSSKLFPSNQQFLDRKEVKKFAERLYEMVH